MLTPQEINPRKVAIYIRWSTDDQGEGTTLQTQLERSTHYLASQGWAYREELVYIDDGYSGGSLHRPALDRLRADVAAGKVECVVVYKIDRLSRSVVDIVDLVLREWEGRCFVKSTTEEVNTVSPAGKMFFYILVSFAEYERNLIRERTMGGKVKRAEQGLNPGFRPPYGYVKGAGTGTLAVVEHEAGVVRRIFDLYLKGNGAARIAHRLNEESIRRRGAPWNPLVVRRILANPAYMGVLAYGRTKERHIRVEGAFPPVVDRATWEEAARLRQQRSTTQGEGCEPSRPSYSGYLLTGIGKCRCGASLVGKRVGSRRYYLCANRKGRGRRACEVGHIPAEPVHAELEQRVRAILCREGEQILTGSLVGPIRERIGETAAAVSQERLALNATAERRRRLTADYRGGGLPAHLYTRELAAVEAEEQAGRERLRQLEERRAQLEQISRDPAAQRAALDLPDPWAALSQPERKQLLRKLVRGIWLYRPAGATEPPTLEIEWIHLGCPKRPEPRIT